MQTFLTTPDFFASAATLHRFHAGNQRNEAHTIAMSLLGRPGGGWPHHTAVSMWRGPAHDPYRYLPALAWYGAEVCRQWTTRIGANGRPYQDNVMPKFAALLAEFGSPTVMPAWLGHPDLHTAYRSQLIAKRPAHYGRLWPTITPGQSIIWPASGDDDLTSTIDRRTTNPAAAA